MAPAFRLTTRPCVSESMSQYAVDFSAEREGLHKLHFLPGQSRRRHWLLAVFLFRLLGFDVLKHGLEVSSGPGLSPSRFSSVRSPDWSLRTRLPGGVRVRSSSPPSSSE